jgi:aquaglyceroporin related protein, other eukaryote
MVAPFLGCLFGGIIYDIFIFTGQSPINTPCFGLGNLFHPKQAINERMKSQKEQGLV